MPVERGLNALQSGRCQRTLCVEYIKDSTDASFVAPESNAF